MQTVEEVLQERGKTHGSFVDHADVCQRLQAEMRGSPNWQKLPAHMKESLEMIVHKMARVLCGNYTHEDHWVDIQGYAKLSQKLIAMDLMVAREIEQQQLIPKTLKQKSSEIKAKRAKPVRHSDY